MKIAVSAQGTDLNAPVDPRMGRAQHFLLVETETMEVEVLENPHIAATGGAGIQAAQLLASKGAQAVITGHCGPNAFATLHAAQIPVVVGAAGTVRDVVAQYTQGQLQATTQPDVGGHFGAPRGGGNLSSRG
ncbi:dinitrogenase iron-molybdenum cofactor biosynthesis protein [candidate division KSB3 bacterium]|uniref:Dinitrogenase iron-molybdenum cofactor biosynthesis protein n=1 Tax=candidate division KSB3 bacterium TaxID=2044937 RepID=A0A9D5Q696_9BACT|nr:dinitrogenase iron-molybdenum cofactor biosynthesis protein [candidate division KSB3 bacterium]MBD3324691.1 dinitrogenase iron-molybdenum cofactor biosynthesis protein [candidate division KSB3 bacterium]